MSGCRPGQIAVETLQFQCFLRIVEQCESTTLHLDLDLGIGVGVGGFLVSFCLALSSLKTIAKT